MQKSYFATQSNEVIIDAMARKSSWREHVRFSIQYLSVPGLYSFNLLFSPPIECPFMSIVIRYLPARVGLKETTTLSWPTILPLAGSVTIGIAVSLNNTLHWSVSVAVRRYGCPFLQKSWQQNYGTLSTTCTLLVWINTHAYFACTYCETQPRPNPAESHFSRNTCSRDYILLI